MTIASLIAFSVLSFSAMTFAKDIPNAPPSPCSDGRCTKAMEELYLDFLELGEAPQLTPKVYSGDCHYKSQSLNPNHPHRSMVFFDTHPEKEGHYFATGFTFFGSTKKYADWDVESTRERVKGAWNNYGPIEINERTLRVVVAYEDGNPAFVYFVRQNPITLELYYITYWHGATQISFCRMTPNL